MLKIAVACFLVASICGCGHELIKESSAVSVSIEDALSVSLATRIIARYAA